MSTNKIIYAQGTIDAKMYEILVNIQGSGMVIAETSGVAGGTLYYLDASGNMLTRPCIPYKFTMIEGVGGTTDIKPGIYKYPDEYRIDFTAFPNTGYQFTRWLLNGRDASTANPSYVIANADKTIQPVFAQVTTP